MTQCKACSATPLNYQIRFTSPENMEHFSQLQRYLENNDLLTQAKENVLIVKEDAVAGLYDYFNDIMDLKHISYRLDRNDWLPIEEVMDLLDFQWIDNVIEEELVNFHMQPIVTAQEEVYAHEMLARFHDHNGEKIGPYEVFQAAKKRNRTYALDRVCRMSAVRSAPFVNSKVFINFIPTSIYSPEHCLRSTVALAEELNIEPSRFVFEVVETEKVDDLAHLKRILLYYRDKGFQYALDDVGEGFSTVEMLEELAPHYMKLDIKFVQGVSTDDSKQAIAKQFLQAAEAVSAIPLAEGIEERKDFIWLKDNGYKLFQGYLFGKPGPIEAYNG